MLFLEKNFCYEWMLVTQSCTTLCDPIDCSPPGSCPWDFPGKDTGMGYHCLLQGSYEWNYCLYNDNHWYYIMQNEESDHLLLPVLKVKVLVAQSCPTLCDPMDCGLSPWNSPGKSTRVGIHSLLQGIFLTRDQTQVSCIAGRFFTVWAASPNTCLRAMIIKNWLNSLWEIKTWRNQYQLLFWRMVEERIIDNCQRIKVNK